MPMVCLQSYTKLISIDAVSSLAIWKLKFEFCFQMSAPSLCAH